MNTHQALRRIRTILAGRLWGGTGEPVFARDSALVTVGAAVTLVDQIRLPAVFLSAGGSTADDQRPDILVQTIDVVVVVSIPGDMWGERPLLGSNRISATGTQGRGIHEIETELYASISQLDASQQFRIGVQNAGAVQAQVDEDTGYTAWRRYSFRAMLTAQAQHQEPRVPVLSEAGGTVTIAWDAPDDTTNLVSYVVRRTTGTIAVAFPTEGTAVPWTSGVSTTDVIGSGTYSYSVFATYDDDGGAWVGAYSDCVTGTITF